MTNSLYIEPGYVQDDSKFRDSITEVARGRAWPTSIDRLVALLTNNPDPLSLMDFETAALHVMAKPLGVRHVGDCFSDTTRGATLLQRIRKIGVRVVVVDGVDTTQAYVATRGFDGVVIHANTLHAFAHADISSVRICGALLQYAFTHTAR